MLPRLAPRAGGTAPRVDGVAASGVPLRAETGDIL